ncbi:hypothetical protein ACHAPV_006336 [Trichoderma viride]
MGSFRAIIAASLALLGQFAAAAPAKGQSKRAGISSIVKGTPVGFASSVTGGGTVPPVYPTTIAQLKSYLTSTSPQNIVISGTFNFAGSEGTVTLPACNAYPCTPSNGGQALLNTLSGCGSLSTYNVTLDSAAYNAINVQSDKTLVGINGATLNGKGLRLSGVSNVIIQNIAITNLNPQYVWGGDAVSLSNTNNVWIDHVKVPLTENYVYYTSGRTPALSGNTLFHAVNNVWSSNSGHAIEGTSNGMGLYEGNYFVNVPTVVASGFVGRLFSSQSSAVSQCAQYLGRSCVSNSLSNSGPFTNSDTSFLYLFQGKTNIVSAASASSIQSTVPSSAGNTL